MILINVYVFFCLGFFQKVEDVKHTHNFHPFDRGRNPLMASSASMFPAAVVVPAAGTLVRPAAQRLEGRRVPQRWDEWRKVD